MSLNQSDFAVPRHHFQSVSTTTPDIESSGTSLNEPFKPFFLPLSSSPGLPSTALPPVTMFRSVSSWWSRERRCSPPLTATCRQLPTNVKRWKTATPSAPSSSMVRQNTMRRTRLYNMLTELQTSTRRPGWSLWSSGDPSLFVWRVFEVVIASVWRFTTFLEVFCGS